MNGFMQLRERMLYMYAADAVVTARRALDNGRTAERVKLLDELCLWLGNERLEEVLA
jgi:hypothetical protein